MLTSITKHMLNRLMMLFAPIEPPVSEEQWVALRDRNRRWAEAHYGALSRWTNRRSSLLEEEYVASKERLLARLIKEGKEDRNEPWAIDQLHRPMESKLKAARDAGFDIGGVASLQSKVHVPKKVVAAIDKVYCEHYQAGSQGNPLRWCFGMMGPSAESEAAYDKLVEYLDGVADVIQDIYDDAETEVAWEAKDFWSFGFHHAQAKLMPLFHPLFGRVCLPLPTPSMLEDLKSCLEVEADVMSEVSSGLVYYQMKGADHTHQIGRWMDGLGEHVMGVKGHQDGVGNWSDVVAQKLRSLCPNHNKQKQEELILWVR